MTLTMFLVTGLLTLFGGALAYGGDLLGRRFGKRRLTLFGLRPRYTAVLITTVTGCAIVALTVAAMTLANETFREWITRGDQIVSELNRNTQLLRDTERRLHEKQAVNEGLTQANQQLKQENQQLQETNTSLHKEYKQVQDQLKDLEKQFQRTKLELAQAENTLNQAQAQVIDLRKQRTRLNREIATARSLQKELRSQNAILQSQNDALQQTNNDLSQQSVQLTRENIDLENKNKDLAKQNQSLTEQNRTLQAQNAGYQRQNAELKAQAEELSKIWGAEGATVRLRPVVIHAGQELARRTLDANRSVLSVQRILRELLQEAQRTAESKGATPDEEGRVVFIPEKTVEVRDGSEIVVTEQASLEMVAQRIAEGGKPVVVVLVSLINVLQGEAVPVEIRLFRDHKVFTKGDEIASTVLECTPSTKILSQLLQFLKQDVREAAINAGVIPRFEPTSEMPSVGEIQGEQLLDLVQRISHYRGKAQVIARAETDIRAGDSLRLTFDVKPTR